MRSWDGTRSPVASPTVAPLRTASSSAGVGGEPGCDRTASAASLSVMDIVDSLGWWWCARRSAEVPGGRRGSDVAERSQRACAFDGAHASGCDTGSPPWKPRVWQTSAGGERRDRGDTDGAGAGGARARAAAADERRDRRTALRLRADGGDARLVAAAQAGSDQPAGPRGNGTARRDARRASHATARTLPRSAPGAAHRARRPSRPGRRGVGRASPDPAGHAHRSRRCGQDERRPGRGSPRRRGGRSLPCSSTSPSPAPASTCSGRPPTRSASTATSHDPATSSAPTSPIVRC